MEKLKVKIKNASDLELPKYATEGSAGMDLRANISSPITLLPFKRVLIPTGISIELPLGYEAQVRARSGLALKHGIGLMNGIGTVDSDYKGDIGVILVNISNEAFTINRGDRIAQLVVAKHEIVEWEESKKLSKSGRGNGGFGSTDRR